MIIRILLLTHIFHTVVINTVGSSKIYKLVFAILRCMISLYQVRVQNNLYFGNRFDVYGKNYL